MEHRLEAALGAVAAGACDRAATLLAQERAALCEDPAAAARFVTIQFATLRLALVDEAHRELLRPALADIAARVDVEHDPAAGPMWHTYRVHADLVLDDRPPADDIRAFAAVVRRTHAELNALDHLCDLIEHLAARGLAELGEPLHELAASLLGRAGDPPTAWGSWARLAWAAMQAGWSDVAEAVCARILQRADDAESKARALSITAMLRAVDGEASAALASAREALATLSGAEPLELRHAMHVNLLSLLASLDTRASVERAAREWLTSIEREPQGVPPIDTALRAVAILRKLHCELAAIDVLSLYADWAWEEEPPASALRWLETLADVLSAVADDAAAADVWIRAVNLDDRLARAPGIPLTTQDYDRIARGYELLVEVHAELERVDEAARQRTLLWLEAGKEAAFSRGVPSAGEGSRAHRAMEEARALAMELARLEAEAERSFRSDARTRGWTDRSGGDAQLADLVVCSAHEHERARERRIAEVRARLRALRASSARELVRFTSFLGADAGTTADTIASWPQPSWALAYRLDRREAEVTVYAIDPTGELQAHVCDVNPATLDATLTVLAHHPEDELEYIAERLTEYLLPDALRERLFDSGGGPLVVSGDGGLLPVPWEVLGAADERLGLRFAVCRTPSLLRTAGQMAARRELRVAPVRALVLANPTGDLPGADQEGERVASRLEACGITPIALPACTRTQFVGSVGDHAFVHFAGHTDFLKADPASSHLMFSDGPLAVAELAEVRLHPDAVFVLSCCESARSSGEPGSENPLGIGAILLLNGASAVVASNWLADDESGLEVADAFYAHVPRPDQTIAEALRRMRVDLHERGRPLTTWALFTFLGHPFATFAPPRSGGLEIAPRQR